MGELKSISTRIRLLGAVAAAYESTPALSSAHFCARMPGAIYAADPNEAGVLANRVTRSPPGRATTAGRPDNVGFGQQNDAAAQRSGGSGQRNRYGTDVRYAPCLADAHKRRPGCSIDTPTPGRLHHVSLDEELPQAL